MKRTKLTAAATALAMCTVAGAATAQVSNDKIKVGFITDMSSLYADIDGKGGLDAVKMAIEDHGGKVLGKPIEILSADHQNKADIAASKAREWMDQEGLDLLLGGTNSGTALAMNKISSEKKRVYFNVGAGTARLTNEECSPYTVHYAYDTVALAKGTGSAVVKQGGKSWFFLTADYAFGHSLESDTAAVVKASGGTVAGRVRHPLSASDFSSFLLQAQSSKAQILGLANAGGDTINAIKAAKEFGISRSMKITGLLMFINDIHSLGLKNTEGLLMTDSWYWDMNDDTRKFASRFFIRNKKMPSSLQGADYSAVSTYLKAVEAAKTDDPDKVMAELKKMKINDFYTKGYIRQDGRGIHDMYLMQVKTAAESKKPWDYLKVVATIPGDQAFGTVAESKCPLLKR
ncbi:ABC transporter substrate-binding protein [Cupriavidus consociatus]|uniref:ABC transporter substrate-binding protein n=1 Tax=Cupriavidus consociatus TaxID=2821357 RepID=UPI001AE70151|nr:MULTISPECIES: ABC transporter substrate-binding protein [unclassified Cupriavidus]MBP0624116.1 ABC transporter substrate-binding protein [Cupriavidus sp. LEh25]MDK2660827.1 ABC transporter substrate-binding protein [Cupriavidus sp. LEh21]